MDVRNHAALVTGGASGLGAEAARALAQQGAKVALLDVNLEAARGLAKEIGGVAVRCDVSDARSAEDAVVLAREAHGPARILVSAAGIGVAKRMIGKTGPMALEEFSRVIAVNLIGTFNLMRLAGADMTALEPLADGERGVIVCTASVAAYEGQIGQIAYSASKGAIVSMTLPAARDLAPAGIRVCAIAPGVFETPLLGKLPGDAIGALETVAQFPARFGRPDEFAALAAHIIENEMLNGEVIRLDGGLRMPAR